MHHPIIRQVVHFKCETAHQKKEISSKEDAIRGKTSLSCEDIVGFCDSFYKEHQSFIFKPFVEGDVGNFGKKPPQYDNLYNAWTADMEKLSQLDDAAPEHQGLDQEALIDIVEGELDVEAANAVVSLSKTAKIEN